MSTHSSLGEAVNDRGFRIGAALNARSLRSDPSYWKTARNEFPRDRAPDEMRPISETVDTDEVRALHEEGYLIRSVE